MPISDYLRNLRTYIGHDLVLVPGVVGIVFNETGDVLLQYSKDGGWWMPGGAIDPGEEPADAVVREVWEETGVQVIPEQIVAVRAQPPTLYPNGDQVTYMSISFRCRPVGGRPHVHDEESLDVRYFSIGALPELGSGAREALEAALKNVPQVQFRGKSSKRSKNKSDE